MNKIFAVSSIIISFLCRPLLGQATLSGTITDSTTSETLAGATLYLPDIKTGTAADAGGHYEINNLPARKVLVQVTYLGYESVTTTIDLTNTSTKNFALTPSVTEINEVVITGLSQATEQNRTPTPITVISHATLLENNSTNIIDALAKQPGISQITTGPAISKPEIRGLGYNRVVVVHDGIRQEGQQWGDEHGIEIDAFSVNKIEILKGPASLAYGSDAMAGVIHMISTPALPSNTIRGNLLGNYQTNNGLIGYSGNIAGNMDGLIWNARYSGKTAHNYKNAYDGYVYGSNFSENAASLIAGLNKKWGYAHLHLGYYALTPGIIEGERDSLTGSFIKPVALNDTTVSEEIVSAQDLKSYTPGIPHQEIRHYKAVLNNSFFVGRATLKAVIGWQQNNRQEFDDVLSPDNYGLYFKLNTFNYDLHYIFPEKNNWQLSAGANGMHQVSENMGDEFLVPAYQLLDAGVFVTAKKVINRFDIAGGIRFDIRTINSDDFFDPANNELLFSAFNTSFYAMSGSIGATYQFSSKLYGKLNLSRGFRAPNIAELGANGIHEGTFRYETGDPALKAETSLQTDAALGYNGTHVSVETNLFNNRINNFIYLRKLIAVFGGDSIINVSGESVNVFKYVQGDANLAGAEITIDIHPHPLDWLHFENSFSFVNALQLNATDSTKYLPYSPAPKLISELRGQFKKVNKHITNLYIKLEVENYFRQDHIYAAYGTETPTPAYILWNAGLGADFVKENRLLGSIYLSLNNIADVAYQDHLSRLKYAATNYDTGRAGVYIMGRNFNIKVVMPLYIRDETTRKK